MMKTVLTRLVITQSELFAQWPAEAVGRLIESADAITCEANTCIIKSGDVAEFLYLVASGSLQVVRRTDSGREFVAWRYFQGGVHGIVPALANTPYEYSLTCKEQTVLVRIPAKLIRDSICNDGRLALPLFAAFERRYRDSLHRYEAAATLSTRARVADLLRLLMGSHTGNRETVEVKLSQDEIAIMLGTQRQVINRALRDMEASGVLQAQYGHITIADLEKLSDFMSDAPQSQEQPRPSAKQTN